MHMHLRIFSTSFVHLRRAFGVPRLICAVGLLITSITAVPVKAGQNQWTSNGPASSGPINSLAVDPSAPLTVYAGSGISGMKPGTVFKSTDGGATSGARQRQSPERLCPRTSYRSPDAIHDLRRYQWHLYRPGLQRHVQEHQRRHELDAPSDDSRAGVCYLSSDRPAEYRHALCWYHRGPGECGV